MTESTEQLLQKRSFYADHAYVLVRRRCLLIAVWAVVIGLAPVALPAVARARGAEAGAATTASAAAVPANDRDADHVDDELEHDLRARPGVHDTPVIVTFDQRVDRSLLRSVDHSVGGTVEVDHQYRNVPGIATTLDDGEIDALARNPAVALIEPDRTVTLPPHDDVAAPSPAASTRGATATPATAASPLDLSAGPEETDPGYAAGVAVAGVDGDAAHDGADVYGPDDIVFGLIDSGVDVRHVDLDGGKVLAFQDFTDRDPACPAPPSPMRSYDDLGHGTHVAATMAGTGEGNARYRGIAPGAALVVLKVFDCNSSTATSVIDAALDWAISNKDTFGIDVLNLSLGASGYNLVGNDSTSRLVNRAVASGLVVAVAAGNSGDGSRTIGTPGVAAQAVTVGAIRTGAGGTYLAPFSSRGPTGDNLIKPDVVAPGVDITSASYIANISGNWVGSGYVSMSGTSMATPFVAGVSGLLLQANPALRPHGIACAPTDVTGDCADGVFDASMYDGVRDVLRASAQDWNAPGPDPETGWGRVRVYDALAAATGVSTPGPAYPPVVDRASTIDPVSNPSDWWALDLHAGSPVAVTATIPFASGFTGPFAAVELYDAAGDALATQMACTGWCMNSATGTYRSGGWYVVPPATGRYWVRIHAAAGVSVYRLHVAGADAVASRAGAVSITRASGPTVLTESGEPAATTAVVRVAMSAAPRAPITLAVTSDGQVTVSPPTLRFTPADYATPQAVTVTAVADHAREGLHASTVKVGTAGGAVDDASFTAISIPVNDAVAPVAGPVTRRVSLRADGSESDGPPVGYEDGMFVGDLGRWVAFSSNAADLVPGDTDGLPDVFVRDMTTSTTARASVSSTGGQLEAGSQVQGVSADGRRVLFMVWPAGTNTVPDDTNNDFDLFVRDLDAHTTQRVNLTADDRQMPRQPGPYSLLNAALSADGRFVAFTTRSRMTPDDTDDVADAYVRDLDRGTTERVSVDGNGHGGTALAGAEAVDISADGRYVLFASDANGLAPGDRPGLLDAFVRDRVAGTTTMVNVDSAGDPVAMDADYAYRAALASDGTHVVFVGCDPLQPWVPTGVFERDLTEGTTARVSLSDDGSALTSGTGLGGVSGDGRFVTFVSLTSAVGDGVGGTFRRDTRLGHTQRLAVNLDGSATAARRVAISPDGRSTAFSAADGNVVTGDRNHNDDVFVRPYVHPTGETPPAPTGLAATPGVGSLALTWDPVVGADDYTVVVGNTTTVTDASSVTVDGLTNGVAATATISARIGLLHSAGVAVVGTPDFAVVPPVRVDIASGNRSVRLSWPAVPGATSYTVSAAGRTTTTSSTSLTLSGLPNGSTVTAEVRATVRGTLSAPAVVRATPHLPAPSSLTGTGSAGTLTLRWSPVPGAVGYYVSGSGLATRYVAGGAITSTRVTQLTVGMRTYVVRAADATERSGASPPVVVRTLARPGPVVASPGAGRVTVAWAAVSGATGYLVWRDDAATPVRTTSRTVVFGSLRRGSRHSFRVAAVTANSTSDRSVPVVAVVR
ncbi:MAG TPA: S8 family serine peptidase [Acidimicrobiia bacterium]